MQALRFTVRLLRSAMPLVLVATLTAGLLAQQADSLTVTVVSGNGAVNDIYRYAPTPTIVEVRDELGQPVSGASVTFSFPEIGPGGRFTDGNRTWTGATDARGRVMLSGFIPNHFEGSYQIAVNVVSDGRSGAVFIRESNGVFVRPATVARGHLGTGSKLLIVVGVGAAVALGSILALKSGGGNTGTVSPTSISIGSISIGAPH